MNKGEIIVVSGLPRSGTSLMMQMLCTGGVPVVSDALRSPDEDNPKGYFELEVVKRPSKWGRYPVEVEPPEMAAFTVLRHRWVVERTFGWVGRYRRMSKDYEYLVESSEAMTYLTMIRLMLKRLARNKPYGVPSPQRLGLTGAARAF